MLTKLREFTRIDPPAVRRCKRRAFGVVSYAAGGAVEVLFAVNRNRPVGKQLRRGPSAGRSILVLHPDFDIGRLIARECDSAWLMSQTTSR